MLSPYVNWLWPYEADCLANVHPAFSAEIKTDNRLTEGCGGVGLLWKKTLDATPIPSIASDRICGLCIKSPDNEFVYLPCADLGTETYCEHIIELERIISDHQRLGPVVSTRR